MLTSDHFVYTSYVMIVWGVSNFISLLHTTAPYGRYVREGWGFTVNAKLAWFVQELPSLVIPLCVFYKNYHGFANDIHIRVPGMIVVALFITHYFHRTIIYPLRLRNSKPIPLIPFVIAFVFCSLNGYLQAEYHMSYTIIQPDSFFVAGIILFFCGMFVNIHSDNILRRLRSESQRGYQVPEGGMFEYVSGANFLGEIIEWTGLAIASRTMPAIAFAIFTCCNIGPRAWHHHR
ncbi:hypothetical protein FSP39_017269 [Pinctada imbricata]|uniref:3-oxo-5-alpha-steroid 4-dehydrogenase C-terminal domain-containing protein n=1 Tax=Pinctada imbricata TaxID=66713 RepID=A0AA88YBH0_PINIB|nr:hypothetical protein FSP39_017269 [Pinctada imbricata]